jgi:hypothetical protein
MIRGLFSSLLFVGVSVACVDPAAAQPLPVAKVDIPWNRYYDVEQTYEWMRALAAAHPDLVRIQTIGKSLQGQDLLVATVTSGKHGEHRDKPAMWIDGNIHGNEIQASEVVLYTMWMLTRGYGHSERITSLLDETTFYLMPIVNPDGRRFWFNNANTPHSSRHNQRPDDDDRDGRLDEDGPDDLDGDGSITQMWKVETGGAGRWVRSQTDDRVFVRLRDDQTPAAGVTTYTLLGEEGIDNDGDGRINEDGPFGHDMNRNWPADWQPEYIQGGAGPFPLSAPETRAIANFLLGHPNVAAAQSYHNTGGMILRGPGSAYRERMYPPEDLRVYDDIARTGEQMLPYYRYLIIFSQLYRVHGGCVNWTAEGLGAIAYTNELWTVGKYFQRDGNNPGDEQMWLWRDKMEFEGRFTPYKELAHPQYGQVIVGGLNKWSSRITPAFMLEEECHRNFAFTMLHAEQTPRLSVRRAECVRIGDDAGPGTLWRVRFEIANAGVIPTRTGLRRRERIGWPDLAELDGATVIAANRLGSWHDLTPTPATDPASREPARLLIDDGVPGRGSRVLEFIVQGAAGGRVSLRYQSDWARLLSHELDLVAPPAP